MLKYKKTPCFKSKQVRKLEYEKDENANITKDIDYSGQNYRTLGEDMTRVK